MSDIKVKDKNFEILFSKEKIDERIAQLAIQISKDFKGKDPLFVVVLNGAFIFAADLIKQINIPCEIAFIRLSSYHSMKSTGKVTQIFSIQEKLAGRDVIIIEDIIDTGNTMHEVQLEMVEQKPASINVCTFLVKPKSMEREITSKYIGFEIPSQFVVGYGLDYEGYGRNSEALYILKEGNK